MLTNLTNILSKASLLPIALLIISHPCRGQQQYKVTPVLENGTVSIPGSPDLFTFNFETGSALDEQYSSFTQRLNGDSHDGIWVLNVTNGDASHLVKLGDPAGPGGAAGAGPVRAHGCSWPKSGVSPAMAGAGCFFGRAGACWAARAWARR